MWSMPSRRLVLSLTRHLSHDKFMWHLGVGQHVTALFKYQGCYIDTATFLNFMSCRKRSNKNICMYIKGSASSKIPPLPCIYISAFTKDFYTAGLKPDRASGADLPCCEAVEVSGGQWKLFSLLHNASTQASTSELSSQMNID